MIGNSQTDVQCPHCHVTFYVPSSMKGGLANCPDCQKAVTVRDGIEILFWLLVTGGVIFCLFLVVGAFFSLGAIGAVFVAVACAIIFTLVMYLL